MSSNPAEILLTVSVKEGYETGRYPINVYNCDGDLIYSHIHECEPFSFESVTAYINKKFVNDTRFENIKAVYDRSADMFMYLGIDRTKVSTEIERN